jgi:hypothetical protein
MHKALEQAKHLLAPLTANCREFHERWRDAAGPRDGSDMTGRWIGEWVSTATGHHGPLRSIVVAATPGLWTAWFHARYARVFRACYRAELHVALTPDGHYTISGRSDLGWAAGGVYEHDGEAANGEIVCRYKSHLDRGEFRLRRIP